jgi:segregation and condensation protein A
VKVLDLDLDVYQGPFDLLLSLVLKEEIDLLEVPLLDVILAYLDQTEADGSHDYWDEMTEFLLLMSLLVEVKSRLLLPGATVELEDGLTPEEARDQLLARLFEYSKFRAAAERLRRLGEDNYGAIMRPPAAESRRRLAPLNEVAGSGDPMELRERLLRLVDSKREPDTSHVAQVRVELQRQIRIVRGVLAKRGRFSFDSIFGGEEPLVQAVSLFALLDLLGRGEIRVSQAEAFGDIIVRASQAKKTA